MVSIAHAAAGSFIAATFPSPWVYIPLCLASHFALDFVRHFDVGVAMKMHHFSKKEIVFYEALDLLIAFGVVAFAFRQTPDHFQLHIWLGAFFGILPDILETSDYFFQHPIQLLSPLYYLHDTYHHSTKSVLWGSLPQIILVSIIVLAARWSW